MRRSIAITLSISSFVAVAAIILNLLTHDSRWIFADIILGFIFLLAAGFGLGANSDGGRTLQTRRIFQEMYRDNPGKIQALNKRAGLASIFALSIALPNLVLPIIAAIMQHYY